MMYLINFALCSGLLLAVYKLWLQNERMYRFNRFYLLFSLVFSVVVPFIVITTKAEAIPVVYQEAISQTLSPVFSSDPPASSVETTAAVSATSPQISSNYLPGLLMGAYLLVSAILIFRYILNLIKIRRNVINNRHINHQQSHLVLTDADITPHSFLNYIFINRKDHEHGLIEPEVICHEQAHVRQLHSLDVLLIELFQALCWFNPFIPLYRKAIQLNHEFLADEAVTEVYNDTPAYQYLLLARASQPGSLQLTSQFNYQTTKKRLMMMTRTTSPQMALGKKLMLLPVAALAVVLFSQKVQAKVLPAVVAAVQPKSATSTKTEVKTDTTKKQVRFPSPILKEEFRVKASETDAPQSLMDEYAALQNKYLGKGAKAFAFRNISAADKARMDELYQQMSRAQQNKQRIQFGKAGQPLPKNTVADGQLEKWKNKEYTISLDGKKVKNEVLDQFGPADFDYKFVGSIGAWARKHGGPKYQVVLMTKPYYANYYNKTMADRSNVMWVRSSVD